MRVGLAFALLGCLAVAGCVGGPATPTPAVVADTPSETPAASPTASPSSTPDTTRTPTPTGPTGTQSAIETASATATVPRGNASVEYVIRMDSLPDHVANVTIEFGGVYFSERSDDIDSCAGVQPPMDNRYDPTPTPLPTPAGACWDAGSASAVTFVSGDGERSLGTFEAPGRFDGGDMLVVRDVVVRLENGTAAKKVYDTDFNVARTEPATETVGLAVSISYDPDSTDRPWDYTVETSLFDPAD